MKQRWDIKVVALMALLVLPDPARATPANKAALDKHYDRFLSKGLSRCTTCHLPSDNKAPESLDEFPHNAFGNRLRLVAKEFTTAKPDIPVRLQRIADEDSDGDGVANEVEILLGRNPGDPGDKPEDLTQAAARRAEFAKFLVSYRWRPFESVQRPAQPAVKNERWVRNPVDRFIAAEHEARNLKPRPQATKTVLLRRAYLDLIGLTPTLDEQRAFLQDTSPQAYERLVDRLLNDPRYGERWGRHWMDVWRYSDWAGWSGGNQIRDSKPHVWRWRDWIVESLNGDKGYDRMLLEMLAADELAPEDTNTLRATGYLVRNYKMLSREQWLEDTIKHTSQAFLGLTMGCAKCHDHMTDPISQAEYYQMRAIFEPHQVRTDRMPGELDVLKDGLVRVYDTATNARTFFFVRGDERKPDTNRVLEPGVPKVLRGDLAIQPVKLPSSTAHPDYRDFVIRDTIAAGERAIEKARAELEKLGTNAAKIEEQRLRVELAEASHTALLAVLKTEKLEKKTDEWKEAAQATSAAQRTQAVVEARLKLLEAKAAVTKAEAKVDEKKDSDKAAKELESATKKAGEAEKALASAEEKLKEAPSTSFKSRSTDDYPDVSTGRRLAFAQWVSDRQNPLTARVAVNHLWLRHFGRGLVPTPENFGRSGTPPSHPQLLDWLAAEFMANHWSMKHLHRLILTSATYRMVSTGDDANAVADPDNVYLWRMPSRRMEAEIVRDNLLHVGGNLDAAMGGPDIDHQKGLTSKRRSLYLRSAAEKEVEFLKIFDGPSVTECYQRRPSVMPQQALALANSELAIAQARSLAKALEARPDEEFVREAFERVLARKPKRDEMALCREFLGSKQGRTRENLLLVLFNHNDFVTIR